MVMRKRVLNEALLDYSGEAYLYAQIRAHTDVAAGVAGAAIKDVSLLSGAVSNGITVLLLMAIAAVGPLDVLAGHRAVQIGLAMAALLVVALIAGLVLFRRRLLTADAHVSGMIIAAHAVRLALVLSLQIAQWMTGLPGLPFSRWLTVLALWMVATRIPFVPNRDLLLAAAGASIAGLLAAPPPAVAALFLTAGALPIVAHGLVLIVTGFHDGSPKK
jgi:hypothetical protein